jgi:hypothetical protein
VLIEPIVRERTTGKLKVPIQAFQAVMTRDNG